MARRESGPLGAPGCGARRCRCAGGNGLLRRVRRGLRPDAPSAAEGTDAIASPAAPTSPTAHRHPRRPDHSRSSRAQRRCPTAGRRRCPSPSRTRTTPRPATPRSTSSTTTSTSTTRTRHGSTAMVAVTFRAARSTDTDPTRPVQCAVRVAGPPRRPASVVPAREERGRHEVAGHARRHCSSADDLLRAASPRLAPADIARFDPKAGLGWRTGEAGNVFTSRSPTARGAGIPSTTTRQTRRSTTRAITTTAGHGRRLQRAAGGGPESLAAA